MDKNLTAPPPRKSSYSQSNQPRKVIPVQGTPNQQQTLTASINFDGIPEIEDDEVFKHMRDYPHKNPHVYRRPMEECKSHTMCQPALMEPQRDNESRLPIPHPMGTGLGVSAFSRQFAVANFDTRNLTKKCGNIKMVMTEEVMDDWEAQTLSIPYEKLVRHKKTMRNLENLERVRNQQKKVAIVPALLNTKKKAGKTQSPKKQVKQQPPPQPTAEDKAKRQQQQMKSFNLQLLR